MQHNEWVLTGYELTRILRLSGISLVIMCVMLRTTQNEKQRMAGLCES